MFKLLVSVFFALNPFNDEGPVTLGTGDLVVFPAGIYFRWYVHKAVSKHYRFVN